MRRQQPRALHSPLNLIVASTDRFHDLEDSYGWSVGLEPTVMDIGYGDSYIAGEDANGNGVGLGFGFCDGGGQSKC